MPSQYQKRDRVTVQGPAKGHEGPDRGLFDFATLDAADLRRRNARGAAELSDRNSPSPPGCAYRLGELAVHCFSLQRKRCLQRQYPLSPQCQVAQLWWYASQHPTRNRAPDLAIERK